MLMEDRAGRKPQIIAAPDAGIIIIVAQVADGQVDRGEMAGILQDVATVDIRKELRMVHQRIEVFLPGVAAHEEGSATAGWIEDFRFSFPDGKGVNQIHDFGERVMLAIAVPLLGADELFVHSPDHVERNVPKIVFVE